MYSSTMSKFGKILGKIIYKSDKCTKKTAPNAKKVLFVVFLRGIKKVAIIMRRLCFPFNDTMNDHVHFVLDIARELTKGIWITFL